MTDDEPLLDPEVFAAIDEHFSGVRDAQARARRSVAGVSVENARAGRSYWTLEADRGRDWWQARYDDEWWVGLRYSADPKLVVMVRLAATSKGVTCTGLLVERDGDEVTARDLRAIQLRSLLDTSLAAYRDVVISGETLVQPARPGPPGHPPEHWRQVWDRYQEARKQAPSSYIRWMRNQYDARQRPSDATMRRWVQTAQRKHERGEL